MMKKSSVSVAKNRLKALVTSDRVQCLPDSYENICRELYETLSKYMGIAEDEFNVEIERTHILISFSGEEA
ncbi:cell division topological specificity factor MinE [Lachnospiraceae bacterium 50-23]|jgi:cell division topological specificity factor|nr:cell division topological specificity factor MinE [Dorea sp.]GFI36332.1 cell division topological specificity factor [Lachnospiraceae bacterium]